MEVLIKIINNNKTKTNRKNFALMNIFSNSQFNRNSHQRCSVKKGVLRNYTKLTGKHLWQSLLLIQSVPCYLKVSYSSLKQ